MTLSTRACTLFSGSSGNSIFIEKEKSGILVDIGVSCKRLEENLRRQKISPYVIKGVLITHEHSDHIAGVSVFARKYKIPVYANELTIRKAKSIMKSSELIDFKRINIGETFVVDKFTCKAIQVSHDAISPVAYKIDTGDSIISVVTDTGILSEYMVQELKGSDLIFLEANYDEEMLWNGPYTWPLKQRVNSYYGHLSNEQSAIAASELIKSGTKRIVLIHLSKNNNRPNLAYEYINSFLFDLGLVNGQDYSLTIAPRYEPSLWQMF